MTSRLVFPNINLVIKHKTTRNMKDIYTLEDILSLLSVIKRYELGGEYVKGKGFILDPSVTNYDYESDRPYTTLNVNSKIGVVWHSHPYGLKVENSYPSLEDLQVCREYPNLIFLILTGMGMYIISIIKETTNDDIVEFYEYLNDYNAEDNFVNYKFDQSTSVIFLSCIPNSLLSIDLIDRYITNINLIKNDL